MRVSGEATDDEGVAADPVFRDVDGSEATTLVAMMDATDAWPAVRAARTWIVEQVAPAGRELERVVDVGSGPGTFNSMARSASRTVDVDRSQVMARAARSRHHRTDAVVADAHDLPLGDAVGELVHTERMLQWLDRPEDALAELVRVTAPGGWLAVTDTDWSTFVVGPPSDAAPGAVADWAGAALRWVPHGRFAASLPGRFVDFGLTDVRTRTDRAVLAAWDPGAPDQFDGPPGLPLRSIAGAAAVDPDAWSAELDRLAAAALAGTFCAELTLVTVLGRRC